MAVGSLVVLAPMPAGAAGVFTVDVLVDTVDAAPGDGVCADASGDCSLRAAILEANALSAAELPGPDEIVLPAGTITLTLVGDGEDAGLTGDLDLWAGTPLRGAGASSVIDGGGLDRVLDTHGLDWWPEFPGPSVTLVDLRVTGGVATDGRGGGGIRAFAQGLSLTNVTVDGNRAEHVDAFGGGVYFPVGFNIGGASLTLTDSTITGNEAVGPGASGGGVLTAGGLVVSGGAVTDNQITNDNPDAVEAYSSLGAGIAAFTISGTDGPVGATVVVDGTTITGNELVVGPGSETLWGGGIGLGSDVDATITASTISDNVATAGGGIASWNTNDGDIAIDTSTISGNTAVAGAFPHDGLGGGVLVMGSSSDVVIDRAEVSGNSAVIGGGIASTNVFDEVLRTVTVRRSTVSGNTASDHGGGIASHSNLIEFFTGTVPPALVLDSSTVSSNVAPTGGGISVGADTTISMEHATVAANTGGGISTGGASTVAPMTANVIGSQATGADCSVTAGLGLVSGGANADSDDSCGFAEPSDLPDVDPLLGPLADNGGPTFTHLPDEASPLLDAAGACTGTDQRGIARPQGAACDVGAVEVVPATSVSGTVLEDGTGSPLEGISVRLIDTATSVARATGTDASGGYSFAGVAAGEYVVRFIDLDGLHTPEYHADAMTVAAATTVVVSGSPVDVDGSLAPDGLGSFRGTVTEVGSGDPLSGVSVRLLSGDGMTLLAGRTTSVSGGYQVGLKAFGSYRMRFIDLDASHVSEWHLNAATRPTSTVISHGTWWTTIDAALAPSS